MHLVKEELETASTPRTISVVERMPDNPDWVRFYVATNGDRKNFPAGCWTANTVASSTAVSNDIKEIVSEVSALYEVIDLYVNFGGKQPDRLAVKFHFKEKMEEDTQNALLMMLVATIQALLVEHELAFYGE